MWRPEAASVTASAIDASTDTTLLIIQEYADRYPHLFGQSLRSENLGFNGFNANLIGALSAACDEYLALYEGDDYWIDPLKLSKQVAYLDRHPKTAAVCFHPVRVTWEDGRVGVPELAPPAERGGPA